MEAERLALETIEDELDYLNHFSRVAIVDALPLGEDLIGIEIWLDAVAHFDVTLSTSGLQASSGIPPSVHISANEQTATTGGSTEVRLIFEATFNPTDTQLSTLSLVRLAPAGKTGMTEATSEKRRRDHRGRKRPRPIQWVELADDS